MRTTRTSRLFDGSEPLLLLLSCLSVAAFTGCGSGGAATQAGTGTTTGQPAMNVDQDAGPVSTPITLVEVFGSEGCGKCPAVDIACNPFASQGSGGIFSVEYHISYQSPWTDVYASKTYDDLAGSYLDPILGGMGSYTYGLPALFINAKYETDTLYPYTKQIAGIPRNKVKPQASIALSIRGESNANPLEVNYDVTFNAGGPTSGVLGVALVERGLLSDITSGDNAGLKLHEENVARAFTSTTAINKAGYVKLSVPSDVVRTNSSVIAFIKDSNYQTLYAASELDL